MAVGKHPKGATAEVPSWGINWLRLISLIERDVGSVQRLAQGLVCLAEGGGGCGL